MAGLSVRSVRSSVRTSVLSLVFQLLHRAALVLCVASSICNFAFAHEPELIKIESSITHVQPMTGIVLWTDNRLADTDAIQLEFRYCGYNEVVDARGVYDFSKIDKVLADIASRKHQAVLRFYFEYVGKQTTVPGFIKNREDYKETIGESEGKTTHFSDWSNAALKAFTLDFYTKVAERYDHDPRIGFLETGFGLWAEYHIYDGPNELGKQFPDKAFQAKFLKHMDASFKQLPWMISVDAVDERYSPLKNNAELLGLRFGVFDDSFLCEEHPRVNAINWKNSQLDRWQRAPSGGEFSFYTKRDQQLALSPEGPNGVSFDKAAAHFHISFILGDGQFGFQNKQRIIEAGMATGYRFHITSAQRMGSKVRLEVANQGVAPIYRDAYFANGEQRSSTSLKGLLPGETRVVELDDTGKRIPTALSIQSDFLVPGQEIQFQADLGPASFADEEES